MAQVALNLDLASRTFRPLKDPLSVSTGYTAHALSSIYRFGQDLISDTLYWFHNAGADVDYVKGAISNDQTERTYFTGNGSPKVTNNTLALTGGPPYPFDFYTLGVPPPGTAPTVVITGVGSGDVESRTYCYTFVTGWGEESAPSPASAPQDFLPGQTVTLSSLETAPAGDYNITAKRIYRSVPSSQGTLFYFVKEVSIATTSTVDDVATIGEPLKTQDWDVPPSGGYAITQMANGIMLIMDGFDVCPSVQYAPYAYPLGYRLSTDFKIVGCKAIGNAAVIGTTGCPYVIDGVSPDALSLRKIEIPQACVSKRSMVAVGGGVVYASPDGLVLIGANGFAGVITEHLFTHEQWQAFNPESIHAYHWNGRYVGFYDTGSVQGGFIFDAKEQDAAFNPISTYATAGYSDLLQDALYLKIGTAIYRWIGAGTTMSGAAWRSGITTLHKPCNFGAARVMASAYPVTLKFYADGALKATKTVANKKAFRLPGNYLANYFEIEVSGVNEVHEVVVASTMREIAGVV